MANYSATSTEVLEIKDYIDSMFGAPVVTVELSGNHYQHAFNTAIEEFSLFITNWAIRSNIAQLFGLDSAQDFTMRWVADQFTFVNSFTRAYSEQLGIGGTTPIYKNYFTLSEGQQIYYLPDDIEVNEIMWQEPPAINRYLIDPNNNPAWVNHEFGWGYMGYSYQYITPLHFTIQLQQATSMRWKIYRGDYEYKILPAGADSGRTGYTGKTRNSIYIFPIPEGAHEGLRVWYFYKNRDEMNNWSGQTSGSVVNNPGTINMNEIPYSAFNSAAQRWVKQYTLAVAKEILGRIRSKFSSLPIPDADVTLDGESLVAEAKEAQDKLKEYLEKELESINTQKMLEDSANNAENINKALSFNPLGIFIG